MKWEMDVQPGSSQAFPPGIVSSSSTTNFSAWRQHDSPHFAVEYRRHPYTIPPSTQLIPSIPIPDLTGLITRCGQDPVSGGTYGNIYRCIYHGPDGNVDVAVKAIRPQFIGDEVFRRELGIWKRLRHSNILKFIGTTSDFGPSVALVAPWIANGTLTSFLNQNNETLALLDRLRLLHDIAAGLNYLHTFSLTEDGRTDLNPVIHGDLTGTNVLVDGDRKAYLADFGLSGTLKQLTGMTYLAKMSCHPGAVRWAAPELLTGEESAFAVTTQSDIYSFGSIMLQVLTGNVPWIHLSRDFQISYQVIIKGEKHPRPDDDRVTDQLWNFMTCCWSMTPTDRPSAKEAFQFVDSEVTFYYGGGANDGGQHLALVPAPHPASVPVRRREQDANFLCPVPGCGSTFTRSFNLKGHMRSHNEERPFQCKWPGCGKGFAREHDCKRHEQLHSNYRPLTCDGCNRTFARMHALNRHLRSEGGADCQRILDAEKKELHANYDDWTCGGCNKTFARMHALNRHLRSEGGADCQRILDAEKQELHANYRPFTCDGCNKTFARMDALNRHLRSEGGADCQRILDAATQELHANYRPFTCDGCNKTFACIDDLNRHLRSEGGADCRRILDAAKQESDPDVMML